MRPVTLVFAPGTNGGLPMLRCVAGSAAGLDLALLGQALARRFELLARRRTRYCRFAGRRFHVAVRRGADRRVPELVLTAAPAELTAPRQSGASGWQACLGALAPGQRRTAARIAAAARSAGEVVVVLAVRGYVARLRETTGSEQAWPLSQAAEVLDRCLDRLLCRKGVAGESQAADAVGAARGGKVDLSRPAEE